MPTLVFDCETVPDVAAIRRVLQAGPGTPERPTPGHGYVSCR